VDWNAPQYDGTRDTLRTLLEKQDPYPGYAINQAGDSLVFNQAYDRPITQTLGEATTDGSSRRGIYMI